MNKNDRLWCCSFITLVLSIATVCGIQTYLHSNKYLNSNIQKLNDKYEFDDNGYQTISTKYTYKDWKLKIDLKTSALPGDNPLGYYLSKDIVDIALLDKDKFNLDTIKVYGSDFTSCGNDGSYCATTTIPIESNTILNTKSIDIKCDTGIFEDTEGKLKQAFSDLIEESSHMLY